MPEQKEAKAEETKTQSELQFVPDLAPKDEEGVYCESFVLREGDEKAAEAAKAFFDRYVTSFFPLSLYPSSIFVSLSTATGSWSSVMC
jgi:hypothetical protein